SCAPSVRRTARACPIRVAVRSTSARRDASGHSACAVLCTARADPAYVAICTARADFDCAVLCAARADFGCATSVRRTARVYPTRVAIHSTNARRDASGHFACVVVCAARADSACVAVCAARADPACAALCTARALCTAAWYRTTVEPAAAAPGGTHAGTDPGTDLATTTTSVAGPPVVARGASLVADAATSDIASAAVDGSVGTGDVIADSGGAAAVRGSTSARRARSGRGWASNGPAVSSGATDTLPIRLAGGASSVGYDRLPVGHP
ncbi:hypothetical protein, partial [Actinoplanes sp. NPDC026623]|uniref:hypothetical protein n=1 Tax=Actinoplanes sp. NPDC026623 TaxID=3155610 RepID=UPI00340AAB7A